MKEAAVLEAHTALKEAGINFVSGLPDGWLRTFHERIQLDNEIRYVSVCNEGVGFSVCAGAWLGGKKTALIMENSGLRVAAEYIARISMQAGIPVVIIMPYRGDLGDTEHWAIPHGLVVEPLLDALRIKYQIVRHQSDLRPAIKRAYRLSEAQLYPTAVLISGDCIWDD